MILKAVVELLGIASVLRTARVTCGRLDGTMRQSDIITLNLIKGVGHVASKRHTNEEP